MPHARELHPAQTLYRKWEEAPWSPWDIDLAPDLDQWPEMASGDRSHHRQPVTGQPTLDARASYALGDS